MPTGMVYPKMVHHPTPAWYVAYAGCIHILRKLSFVKHNSRRCDHITEFEYVKCINVYILSCTESGMLQLVDKCTAQTSNANRHNSQSQSEEANRQSQNIN
jgi:hypothetical protein